MAVAFDAATSANGANGGVLAGVVTATHTPVGTPTGAIVWVAWYNGEFNTTLTSMTYGGVAMVKNQEIIGPVGTRIDHSGGGTGPTDNGNYWKIILFGLASPPAGAQTVTAQFSGLDVDPIMGVVTVTGSDLNNIFRATGVTASGTSTTPGITVPSAAGDLVVDVVVSGPSWSGAGLDGFNVTDLTTTGSNTRRCNQTVTNFGNTNTAAGSTVAGATSITTAWAKTGSSGAHWYMAAASVRAANTGWSTIPVGGGGFCDGIDIASDGTKLLRSDTHPAPYFWSGGNWLPLSVASSMPPAFANTRDSVNINASGTWGARICPSFTCKFYMITIDPAGDLFVTIDSGSSWTQLTNFPVYTDMTPNDSFRSNCYRMAVDPQNDAILFVGTVSGGLQRTLDSGSTWSTRTVGSGTGTSGAGMIIAFDPTSTVTASITQGLFVGRYSDGVYHSTDAGGTFTKLNTTGMPTLPTQMMVDQTGVLWVVNDGASGSGTLWSWTSSTWTQDTGIPFNCHSFDVDPSDSTRRAMTAGGGKLATFSSGTWHNVGNDVSITANDAAWTAMSHYGGIYSITDGNIRFDPQVAGKLWQAYGLGIMYAANVFASTSAVTFTTNVKGVECIDATAVLQPPGGNVIGVAWDMPIWNFTSYTAPPSQYKPASYNNGIAPLAVTSSRGWALDFAKSDPTFIVAITGFIDNGAGASGYSLYSSNSGVSWTYFPAGTQSGTPFGGGGGFYGSVAVSTTSNFVVQNGNGLYFTTDGGATFTAATYAGNNGTYFIIPGKYIAADPNAANTFLIISPGDGIYRSTNSGSTWSKVSSHTAASAGLGQRIAGIPGQSGHFLMTGGYLDTGTPPQAGGALYRSTNNGTTWAAISNVGEVWCMDYGTTVSGQSYPTIYFVGWANPGTGSAFGVWKTIDNFTTFTLLGNTNNPMGWYSVVNDIAGDKNLDGTCSIAYFGGGFKRFTADAGGGGPVTPAFGFSVITDSGQRRARMIGY